MKRNKESILASGIDPDLKRLRKLHAARRGAEKALVATIQSIEDYWDEVEKALPKEKK